MTYYEVAPIKIVRATSRVFTYHSEGLIIAPGQLVTVPVGKQQLSGVVVRSVPKPSYDTKPITDVLDYPPLPPALLATIEWMSEYYATHLATVLQTALPRGLTTVRRPKTTSSSYPIRDRTHFLLNPAQQAAVASLTSMSPGTAILHGITGSGKTAVYIELARQILKSGQSVVMLVPEIALTSQLVAEFQHHFQDTILTHSKQTESERHRAWSNALASSTPRIVIGPRSALFMPLASIGLIIIDEAHEPSFKQDQSPRYSALRVASILAQHHQAKVIQGSATPLISEYYLAQAAGRPIVELPDKARADAVTPTVSVVDMTKKGLFTKHRFLSDMLLAEISATLEAKNQILIFHNRRGSASTTLCENCGWSAICPRCFVPFTLHSDSHELICHICGTTERVPTSCPDCHDTDIIHRGIGTKLIESELRRLFPRATIARFDGDTDSKQTLEQRYQEIYDGTIDILIGTQVLAKGLDLPHLRLVGVIQADAGLSLPDFTSTERTFQLLSQVVGRVGRSSHPTHVVVQSYQPEAPAVTLGIGQNYAAFYQQTLAQRKQGHFPPFTFLLKLTCLYKTEAAAIKHSKAFAAQIRQDFPDVIVLGPTPAFYERQHDTYRWQIVVRSNRRAALLEISTRVPPTHWHVDIDPASLL